MTIDASATERYRDELAEKIGELVRIPSVRDGPLPGMPFGRPLAQALSWALEECGRLGMACENVDNYAGHADFGEGREIVAALSHLDVVPPGEGWSHDPFDGARVGNRVRGRGSADNKCSAVAAIFSIRVLQDLGAAPRKRIRLIFGTDEESGSSDMPRYFERMPLPDLAFVPDAGDAIINREKGRLLLRLVAATPRSAFAMSAGKAPNSVPASCEVRGLEDGGGERVRRYSGKAWHAAWPAEGINAASLALADLAASGIESRNALIDFLSARVARDTDGSGLGIACADGESGALTVNLGVLRADRGESQALLDIRYPVTRSGGPLAEAVASAARGFGVEARVLSDVAPLFVDGEGELVRKLAAACEKVTGSRPALAAMGGRTYASCLGGRGVAYGPGAGEGAHQADEYVDLDRLMRHLRISTQALYDLACEE